MFANLLILTGIVAFVFYRRSVRPRQLDGGEWCVVDHTDSTFRSVLALFALLIGTQFAFGLGVACLEALPKKPGPVGLGLLVLVGGYGWLLWTQGRKVYEALYAARGEFRVADWPLAAGEHVEVTYQRRLYRGIPAGEVKASLVHYEVYHDHGHNGRHGTKHKRVLKRVQLQEGEATYRNKELVATWRFQVPNPMGNPHESLRRSFFELLSNRHRDEEWWQLEVEMPLQGGTVLDSQFKLDIQFVPGRTQFHLGA